jgi:hypothetical protein
MVRVRIASPNWDSPVFAALPPLALIEEEFRKRAAAPDAASAQIRASDPKFAVHCESLSDDDVRRLAGSSEAELQNYRDHVVAAHTPNKMLPPVPPDDVLDANIIGDDNIREHDDVLTNG